jgi:hypothetical protein
MTWIPASAGMTDPSPLVTGFRDPQPVLVLPLIENRFLDRSGTMYLEKKA